MTTPETTILDGVDLELAPVKITREPIRSTAIGQGHNGQVHFRWAVPGTHYRLVLSYEKLNAEEARRLLNILGPTQPYSRVLAFNDDPNDQYIVPGRVQLRLTMKQGYSNLTVEMPSTKLDNNLAL